MVITENRQWDKLKKKHFDFLRFFNAFFDDFRAVDGYTEIKIWNGAIHPGQSGANKIPIRGRLALPTHHK
jgi:hypothetical protein